MSIDHMTAANIIQEFYGDFCINPFNMRTSYYNMTLMELLCNLVDAKKTPIEKTDEYNLKLRRAHIQNIYGQLLRCKNIKIIHANNLILYVDKQYIYWNNGKGLMTYKLHYENYCSIFYDYNHIIIYYFENYFHVVHNAVVSNGNVVMSYEKNDTYITIHNSNLEYYICGNCFI